MEEGEHVCDPGASIFHPRFFAFLDLLLWVLAEAGALFLLILPPSATWPAPPVGKAGI
jgi:hypothetical protein